MAPSGCTTGREKGGRDQLGNLSLRLPGSLRAGEIIEVRTKLDHNSPTGLALKDRRFVRVAPEFYIEQMLVGGSGMRGWHSLALVLVAFLGGCAAGDVVGMPRDAGGMRTAGGPRVPPVRAYADEQEIWFIHTEASDTQVAKLLTDMMDSPVLVVPSLAQAPAAMLANVYVFTNGVEGDGPFGFQPDVFDQPPGSQGYSPLRAVHLVKWENSQAARELRSVADVNAAEAKGEVTIERSGIVVNMPMLSWPGGRR